MSFKEVVSIVFGHLGAQDQPSNESLGICARHWQVLLPPSSMWAEVSSFSPEKIVSY